MTSISLQILQVRSNVILSRQWCYFVGELHSPNARTGAYATEEQCQKVLFGSEFGAEVEKNIQYEKTH